MAGGGGGGDGAAAALLIIFSLHGCCRGRRRRAQNYAVWNQNIVSNEKKWEKRVLKVCGFLIWGKQRQIRIRVQVFEGEEVKVAIPRSNFMALEDYQGVSKLRKNSLSTGASTSREDPAVIEASPNSIVSVLVSLVPKQLKQSLASVVPGRSLTDTGYHVAFSNGICLFTTTPICRHSTHSRL
ncbi:unnamed protein product [Caretta caretta]